MFCKDLPKGLLSEANNPVLNSTPIGSNLAVTYRLGDETFTMGDGKETECVLLEALMELQMRDIGADVVPWSAGLGLCNPIHAGVKSEVAVGCVQIIRGAELVQIEMGGWPAGFSRRNSATTGARKAATIHR